jgi:antitoxin component YwqK of YwqJK toxin-antitoxin module
VDYFDIPENELFMTVHFIDSTLKSMQGEFAEFYKNGEIFSQGDYLNNKKNGRWLKWEPLGHQTDSINFGNGFAVTTT